MVSVEIPLYHQRIEKHERSMVVSVEGKRHQTMKLSSTTLKAVWSFVLCTVCCELCAAEFWAVLCCELCGAVCCAVLCGSLCCAVLWAALLVMRGASRCKIATALETATPLTYLEEPRALYLSFFWHILETNFSSTQKSTLERRKEIHAQILTENWIWRRCHVWPCHEARVHYIFHLIISEWVQLQIENDHCIRVTCGFSKNQDPL